MRRATVLVAFAAGCYAPTFTTELPCSESGNCPDGQSCNPVTQVCEPDQPGATFYALSAGANHTCGIEAGSLYCWGANDQGQLGFVGDDALAPTLVGTDTDWTAVDAGGDYTCGIRGMPGTLWCWGGDDSAQLGAPQLPAGALHQVGNASDWIAVATGNESTCGIRTGGMLWCWGANAAGEAGTGSNDVVVLTPTQIGTGQTWQSVSTSLYLHSCAIDGVGALWCWGTDTNEQLGDGAGQIDQHSPEMIDAGPWTQVVALSHATCGLKQDGSLWCWGGNQFVFSAVPIAIDPDKRWKALSDGSDHLCAVRDDDTAWCMGTGLAGELGAAAAVDATDMQPVVGIGQWHGLTGGVEHTCGLLDTDNRAWCWGSNDRGQLGRGIGNQQTQPVEIEGSHWTAIATGDRHTCGIRSGAVGCFGANGTGQLGNGTTAQEGANVEPMSDAIAVAAGDAHTCALDTGHHLWCWGANADGQLGTGTVTAPVLSPTQIGAATWTAIAAAGDHTCGVQTGGSLWCWGGFAVATPTQIPGITGWTSIAVHDSPYVSGVANGTRYDWPAFNDLTFTPTPLDSSTSYVYGNGNHTCSLHSGHELLCAGGNESGELGDGTTQDANDGVDVLGPRDWKDDAPGTVGLGDAHTCALHMNGTLSCWGANEAGELGIGSTVEQHMPAPVALDGVVSLAGGGAHTCAIATGGALYCWGSDSNGQLGDDRGGSAIPARVTAP